LKRVTTLSLNNDIASTEVPQLKVLRRKKKKKENEFYLLRTIYKFNITLVKKKEKLLYGLVLLGLKYQSTTAQIRQEKKI
jgi:hypothetical protein